MKYLKFRISGVASAALAFAAAVAASDVTAATLISDDFESYSVGNNPTTDLRWDFNTNGIIASNPNMTGNTSSQVVGFTSTQAGGDLFSKVISLVSGQLYKISFDYFGTSGAGGGGGFAGVSATNTANHLWYYSDAPSVSSSDPILVSDGTWRSYAYQFTAPVLGTTDIRLMFEDFRNSGNNAFFDNIKLSAVPLPAAAPLFLGGMGMLGWFGWRRKRAAAA